MANVTGGASRNNDTQRKDGGAIETCGLENVSTFFVLPIFNRLTFGWSVYVGTFGHTRPRVCNGVYNSILLSSNEQ